MEPAAPSDADADSLTLNDWSQFHDAVDALPAEECEIVGLIYYHGWPQADIAAMLRINVRTVRRRWNSALVKISETVKKIP